MSPPFVCWSRRQVRGGGSSWKVATKTSAALSARASSLQGLASSRLNSTISPSRESVWKKCAFSFETEVSERFEPGVTESLTKEVYHWARRLTLLYYVATVFDLKLFSNLFLLVRFSLLFLRLCLYVVCCHSSWSVLELLCIALFSFSSFVPAPKRERNRSPCFLIRHTARERLLWPLFPFQPIFKLLFAAETKISNFPTKPFFNYFPWRWN